MLDWKRLSAIVRVVHTPTGVEATCDSDRSQHRNRNKAMAILKARLWAFKNLVRPKFSDKPLATYTLPPGQEDPNELADYKKLHENQKRD